MVTAITFPNDSLCSAAGDWADDLDWRVVPNARSRIAFAVQPLFLVVPVEAGDGASAIFVCIGCAVVGE
jgi:hypothetical protein